MIDKNTLIKQRSMCLALMIVPLFPKYVSAALVVYFLCFINILFIFNVPIYTAHV